MGRDRNACCLNGGVGDGLGMVTNSDQTVPFPMQSLLSSTNKGKERRHRKELGIGEFTLLMSTGRGITNFLGNLYPPHLYLTLPLSPPMPFKPPDCPMRTPPERTQMPARTDAVSTLLSPPSKNKIPCAMAALGGHEACLAGGTRVAPALAG